MPPPPHEEVISEPVPRRSALTLAIDDLAALASLRAGEFCLALLLLIAASPLLLGIALAVWVLDGRPILHRGWRLGLRKRRFRMLKFRTLVPGADRIIGSELLNHRHRVKTRLGDFLRETRLDELPQLINILRGDMTLFGPRPVRPEVYADACASIPHYDVRFRVKPGLLGYSQLFTPHGAPKALRTRIDNRFIRRPPTPARRLRLIASTLMIMAGSAWRALRRTLVTDWIESRILRRYPHRRDLKRVRPERASVWEAPGGEQIGSLVDINESSFLLRCRKPAEDRGFGGLPRTLIVRIEHAPGVHGPRVKQALCRVEQRAERPNGASCDYVFDYTPVSDNGRYVVDQYFLQKSIASFRRVLH